MTVTEARIELPTERDDRWHYAPLDEITDRVARSVRPSAGVPTSVSPSLIESIVGTAGPRMVFVNGYYVAWLSDHGALPAGVRCDVSDADHADRAGAAVVSVGDGVRFEEPIHVVHLAVPGAVDEPGALVSARTIVDVGAGAHVTVVEAYAGLDGPSVADVTTSIRVGDRADVAHYRIQNEASAATHIGRTRIDQGADSAVRTTSVTVGGDVARNAIEVHLGAPDARIEISGISVTGGHQRHDTVVTVDHAASNCASSQRFIGVVDDHGRGAFSGEIIVRPGTTGTDAHQTSRNLVLDPNAEADARPWLTILADDVRCTHGATVGRLDEEALHYLRSRGIALGDARAMLIDAFVRDVTDAISHEPLREHVAALVAAAASNASTTPAIDSARSTARP